mgnify:CR=1 FL=1
MKIGLLINIISVNKDLAQGSALYNDADPEGRPCLKLA